MDYEAADTVPESERALALRVRENGDERAFLVLYERCTPALSQLVLRMMDGAIQEAEDVVQETWLRAVRGLDRFRWESRFTTWLTAIALNVIRTRRRVRRWEVSTEAVEQLEAATAPPAACLDLERAIAKLPAGYRAVLLLHDLEGYTHREIATMLHITEGTSKSQLFQARRALRAMWPEAQQESVDA